MKNTCDYLTEPYLTNQNFKQKYLPKCFDKKSKKSQTQQISDEFQMTFQPQTNCHKFFRNQFLLKEIDIPVITTKLDECELRTRYSFNFLKNKAFENLDYTLLSPKKNQIKIKNSTNFAKKLDLNSQSLQKITDYKNFKCNLSKQESIEIELVQTNKKEINFFPINYSEIIDKNNGDLILIIKNEDFQIINTINNLKFCYYFVKKLQENLPQNKLNKLNKEIINKLKEELKINQETIYLFDKFGNPLENIFHLRNNTLVISQKPIFKGFNKIKDQVSFQKIQEILQFLEKPLINLKGLRHIKSFENNIIQQNKKPINYIQNLLIQQPVSKLDDQIYQNFNDGESYIQSFKSIFKKEQKENQEMDELVKDEMFKYYFKYNNEQQDYDQKEIQCNFSPLQKKQLYRIAQLLDRYFIKKQKYQNKKHNTIQWDKLSQIQPQQIVKDNINKMTQQKTFTKQLVTFQQGLQNQNIPRLMLQTNLNRKTLFQFHTIFQVLSQLTLINQDFRYEKEKGISFQVYKNEIRENIIYNDDFLQYLFNLEDYNRSGFMGWNEFLNLIIISRTKNLNDKMNLTLKNPKQNDGQNIQNKFTAAEILERARFSLKKIVFEDPEALEDICQFFTTLIFKTIGKNENQVIHFNELKEAIEKKNKDSNLLAMFCGADS